MKKGLCVLLVLFFLGLSGCAQKQQQTVYIAQQFGTAYVPIALMQQEGLLEARLPEGVTVEWSQLGNTTAIREAMLAGKADIGCMAIPPFLIGLDGGMPWRIASGISSMPMGLVARDSNYHSIADITEKDRIALPQPGSIQHILLAMAAERELGDASRFDTQLVTLNHPDGMSALLSGADVTLHFTTAPYLGEELNQGMQLLLTGAEAMGAPFTGIVAVARDGFYEDSPALYQAFIDALSEAMARIQADPAGVAEMLAPVYEMTPEALLAEMTDPEASYHMEVEGLSAFADFMRRTGYINELPEEDALVFPNVTLP